MLLLRILFSLILFIHLFYAFPILANASVMHTNNILNLPIKVNLVSIDNFYQVDKNYYRGAQPDYDEYVSLALLGVKTVINLRTPRNYNMDTFYKQKDFVENLGMKYINIPMSPWSPPTDEQVKYFFQIVNNPANLPVYVHCAQGRDRTGIMTALYRIKNYGWDFNKAYLEMKEKGYHEFLFPRQKEFLGDYIKSLIKTKNNFITDVNIKNSN